MLGAVRLIQPFGYPPGGIADKGTKHQVLKLQSCLILGLNHHLLLRVPGHKMDEESRRGRESKNKPFSVSVLPGTGVPLSYKPGRGFFRRGIER